MLRGSEVGRELAVPASGLLLTRRTGPGALQDAEVSSRHAEIQATPAGYLLRDLGSTNGTFVNGQSIQEALLKAGDEILIGRTVLRWCAGIDPEPSIPREDSAAGGWAPTREFRPRGGERRDEVVGPWAQLAGLENGPVMIESAEALLSDLNGHELLDFKSLGMPLKIPQGATVMLEVVEGPEKGRVVTFTKGEMAIGRYGTDVVIKDTDISRLHAILYLFGRDQIFIRDMKSTNGVFVNGVRSRFARVQSGDTLVLGRSLLHVVVRTSV